MGRAGPVSGVLVLTAVLLLAAAVVVPWRCSGSGPATAAGGEGKAGVRHSGAASGGRMQDPGSGGKTKRERGGREDRMPPRLDAEGLRILDGDPASVLSGHAAGNGSAWSRVDDDLLVAWASRDREAAWRWVEGGTHGVGRARLLGAIAAGILAGEGVEAMRGFLLEHQADPALTPQEQGKLEESMYFHLGRSDTMNDALALLREKPDGAAAGMLVLGIGETADRLGAVDSLGANGIPIQTDDWRFQRVFGEDSGSWADWAEQRDAETLNDVIDSWAREDPEGAREWIGKRIEPGDPRRARLEEILNR